MPRWLTKDAERALAAAEREARMRRQAVGTPHLLLGLLADERGRPAAALHAMGFSVPQVRYEAARKLGRLAPKPARSKPGRSRRVSGILEGAMREAAAQGRSRVEPHDLLVALVAEPEGKAAALLESMPRTELGGDPGMVSVAL